MGEARHGPSRFNALRHYLRVARGGYDEGPDLVTRLDRLGPFAVDELRGLLDAMTDLERPRADPVLVDDLSRTSDVDRAALVARAVADTVMRARLQQKFFADHCADALARLDRGERARVLADVREVASHFPRGTNEAALANAAKLGWLITHPLFVDNLFFVPGLAPVDSHALLHHVPKTGGTSLNHFLVRQVPSAYLLFPCMTYSDLVAMGGALFGADLLNELSARPRHSLVLGGHFNLSIALRRAGRRDLRCVSLFGDPDRLLSSGLRHYLSIAAADPLFARGHGLTDAHAETVASIVRDGAHGSDASMRDIVDRMLASHGFRAHFRDPLARWFLPPDTERYGARLAKFESLVATAASLVLHERPSERCLTDLGLAIEPGAPLGRDNASGIPSAALAALIGGNGWLRDRFRAHDLIGCSDQFHRYLRQHHDVRVPEPSVA